MIRLVNVSKTYPASARPALDNVCLEIDKGEFVFLIGPSGSGKSTVLRLLLREELPTRGTVMVNNRNVGRLPGRKVPALRRQIGCVFQDFRLLPKMTVYENVAFALEVINKSPRVIRRTVPDVLARDLPARGGDGGCGTVRNHCDRCLCSAGSYSHRGIGAARAP